MTLRELMLAADRHPLALLGAFLAVPLLAWLCGLLHGKGRGGTRPWRYVYSVLVYVTCVPGLLAAVLVAYSMFFARENLLDAGIFSHFLPILSMIAALVVIRRNVSFDEVPGFDRLSGLMITIGCCFALALAVEKTRIWIWFGGSLGGLLIMALGFFVLFRWGTWMLFGRKDRKTD